MQKRRSWATELIWYYCIYKENGYRMAVEEAAGLKEEGLVTALRQNNNACDQLFSVLAYVSEIKIRWLYFTVKPSGLAMKAGNTWTVSTVPGRARCCD